VGLLSEGKTERIDLGDGDWVEVRVDLTVPEALAIAELEGLTETTLKMLTTFIKAWSEDAELTEENIMRLKAPVANKIIARLMEVAEAQSPKARSSPSRRSSKRKGRSPTPTP